MKNLPIWLLMLFSANAWSCSCGGVASIKEAIAAYPVLVEAKVVNLEQVTYPEHGPQVHSVLLKVTKVLKGKVAAETITVAETMCYSTLHLGLMKLGHTYILPLMEPMDGRHALAACAHSGMELVAEKLYTFEQTNGVQRRLQFYKNYSEFIGGLKK